MLAYIDMYLVLVWIIGMVALAITSSATIMGKDFVRDYIPPIVSEALWIKVLCILFWWVFVPTVVLIILFIEFTLFLITLRNRKT